MPSLNRNDNITLNLNEMWSEDRDWLHLIQDKGKKGKGRFIGLFQHCGRSAYYPQQVPAFISRGATHHTDARDLYQRGRELLPMNFVGRSVIYENPLGSFTWLKAGTWDILFYFPSEGRYTEDFPDAQKIQRLRPGLNPRTRVPVASMLTTRPPKPSWFRIRSSGTFLWILSWILRLHKSRITSLLFGRQWDPQ